MKLAALNTSSDLLGVALFEDARCVAEQVLDLPMRQSEGLLPKLTDMLDQAGWRPVDLNALAVSLGPGSFTGLRGSLAMAKGAAAANANLVVLGVCELMARAERLHLEPGIADKPVAVWLDGRHGQVYRAVYLRHGGTWRECAAPAMVPLQQAADEIRGPHWITGDALARYADLIPATGVMERAQAAPKELWSADAAGVGRLACHRLALGERDDASALEPLYLRRSEAEIKWDILHPKQGA